MMGTSIFYSSGDDGVAGNGGACLTASGSESGRGTRFNPEFPSTCPFVTSVGATQVNPGSTVNDPEGACEQVIFSGGGFSNVRMTRHFVDLTLQVKLIVYLRYSPCLLIKLEQSAIF